MFKRVLLFLSIILIPYVFGAEKQGLNTQLNTEFFCRFNDKYLTQYINEAYENNHDAKQAVIKVEEYRQYVKMSFAKELPSFSVSAAYLGINVPKFNNYIDFEKNAFVLPFTVNYEADLFLKNRDKTKSAKKTYEMSKFDVQSVYLSLFCDVATVYTNIIQYDELINKAKILIKNYEQIFNSDKRKFVHGIINTTELNNSKSKLDSVISELENLIKQRDVLLAELAVLTGASAECAKDLKRGSINDFEYQGIIPDEIKSDIIFSRPDVKKSEAELEKARIDIRIARKEFLPSFNIVGIWAFNTLAPGTFFSWESSLAAILAGATQDIFTGGRKIANLKYQKAIYEELFEKYRQVDLNAVKEVNTALCFIKHDTNIENTRKETLLLELKNLNNAGKMLARGVISQKEYLTSQNMYITRNTDLIKAKTNRLIDYYTLYKAAGGSL